MEDRRIDGQAMTAQEETRLRPIEIRQIYKEEV